ncbi:MAG: hypothetical protein Q8N81_01255, partial [bacterium]|nr:hypothetical protein [bacterium]
RCVNFSCVPGTYAPSGQNPLTIYSLTSLPPNPASPFIVEFNADVNIPTSSTAVREFLTARAQGSYTPGSSAYDVTYLLLGMPTQTLKPEFHEIPP